MEHNLLVSTSVAALASFDKILLARSRAGDVIVSCARLDVCARVVIAPSPETRLDRQSSDDDRESASAASATAGT